MTIGVCDKCGKETPEPFIHCPECMKEAGAHMWRVEAVEYLLTATKAMAAGKGTQAREAAVKKLLEMTETLKG